MNIAFYAPLKSPGHPHPSGDRLLARALIRALETGGHQVGIASELRSFEGHGNTDAQQSIRRAADGEIERLLKQYRTTTPPDAWFSYHIYHKAPDWVGPTICELLSVPYIVAEASVSPKQQNGPWRDGHRQAIHCINKADAMIALNKRDMQCALPHLSATARHLRLKPFIEVDKHHIKGDNQKNPENPDRKIQLVSVAMMRRGDKMRSFEQLAEWLGRLPNENWYIDVVGDGVMRAEVERLISDVAGTKATFHGQLEGDPLHALLDQSDILVWPAINEAFGMVFLEASTHHLAVAAGRNGGVTEVVYNGLTGMLLDAVDTDSAARGLNYLIERPDVIARMGNEGYKQVTQRHDINTAAIRLTQLLEYLCGKSY
ncbi:MAG: glycosyl transferase [marine bacterium B5-7]|nr:MAG: glycosyl transferase [marine bacterium B5-7]